MTAQTPRVSLTLLSLALVVGDPVVVKSVGVFFSRFC